MNPKQLTNEINENKTAYVKVEEVLIFFIWPITSEYKELSGLRKYFTTNPRLLITRSLIMILLLWLILQLPHIKSLPATIAAVEEQVLYAPYSGEVVELMVERGDFVTPGQLLIRLKPLPLDNQIKREKVETKILETQTHILGQSDQYRRLVGQKKSRIGQVPRNAKDCSRKTKKDEHLR